MRPCKQKTRVHRFPPDEKFFPHLGEQVGWPRVTLSFLRNKCAMVWDDTRLTPNKIPLGPYDFPDASEHYLRRTYDSGEVELLPALPIPK